MLLGLVENAFGWHISGIERKELEKKLKKKFGRELEKSGVGFVSMLQFQLRFTTSLIPPLMHYDDLWAQHLEGGSFIGENRNYDSRAIKIMNAERGKKVAINDLGGSSAAFSYQTRLYADAENKNPDHSCNSKFKTNYELLKLMTGRFLQFFNQSVFEDFPAIRKSITRNCGRRRASN